MNKGNFKRGLTKIFRRWKALPPLIRAGTAGYELEKQRLLGPRLGERAVNLTCEGLMRRAAVTAHQQTAHHILGDLFVLLAKEADEEAEASGLLPLVTTEEK